MPNGTFFLLASLLSFSLAAALYLHVPQFAAHACFDYDNYHVSVHLLDQTKTLTTSPRSLSLPHSRYTYPEPADLHFTYLLRFSENRIKQEMSETRSLENISLTPDILHSFALSSYHYLENHVFTYSLAQIQNVRIGLAILLLTAHKCLFLSL